MDTTTLLSTVSSTIATLTQALVSSTATTTTAVSHVSGWSLPIDWSRPNWDLFIVLFVVLAVFIYGLSLGRDRVLIMTLAIYISLAIVDHVPYLQGLLNNTALGANTSLFQIVTFGGTFVILFFLLARSALLHSLGARDVYSSWWQVLLFSALQVGLVISIVLSFLPQDTLAHLSPITLQIFSSEPARLCWIIAPVVGMMLGRAKRRTRKETEDYL